MTARVKDTAVTREGLRGPHLVFTARADGDIDMKLSSWRHKANGAYEHFYLTFEPITVDQAANIGSRARRAISFAWGAFEKRARDARMRVMTLGDDNA